MILEDDVKSRRTMKIPTKKLDRLLQKVSDQSENVQRKRVVVPNLNNHVWEEMEIQKGRCSIVIRKHKLRHERLPDKHNASKHPSRHKRFQEEERCREP